MKNNDANELSRNFEQFGYYLDRKFESIINLSIELGKPLFLEGFPGVGKTELAKVIAKKSNVELIRLVLREVIDINQAVYDWNYSKQIVSIRINEMNQKEEINKVKLSDIYSVEYLIERPILSCIHLSSQQRPVLLIDEIDRADESFEAFLLNFYLTLQLPFLK